MATLKTETVHLRVKRLRKALDIGSQQAMADYLGVSVNRWNNVERGLSLGLDLATRMCMKIPGLTLDWLYFGKPEGLSQGLAQRLGELPGKTNNRRSS